jgi:putative Mg2+ transporter-C (MgtC) family protein
MITDAMVVTRLLIAALLGGLIGLEREVLGKAAGLRTHILVAVGSALLMLVSIKVSEEWASGTSDPGRIAAQVVTGIGFLGAGTIIRDRANIRGLTTAASIWAVSAIGLATAIGFYSGAVAAAIITLIVLFIFQRIEFRTTKK